MNGRGDASSSLSEVIAYVALGSNLGDRERMLGTARADIEALPGTRILACSVVEETEPIGPVEQPSYLNQMLAVATTLTPHSLLDALLEIERRAGRVRESQRWTARTLDCDIVRYGEVEIDDDRLTIPHPELRNRDFWQRELGEIEASLRSGAEATCERNWVSSERST